MSYTAFEHSHRFAGWAAANAAGTSPKCRFRAEIGLDLIEESGLKEWGLGWNVLPSPEHFDSRHRDMRCGLVRLAQGKLPSGDGRSFTHGVAAKLINIYLKALFIAGLNASTAMQDAEQCRRRNAIHPPIDRLLLEALERADVGGRRRQWRRFKAIGWSNYRSAEYEEVIEAVRDVTEGQLWTIESHWVGFR